MKPPWILIIIGANLIGLLSLAFVYPTAMVSPGALVPAHAELAGKCFACHAPFQGAATHRCISCHAVHEIGVRTTRGAPIERLAKPAISASFHRELSEQNCTGCHSEHGRLTERRFSHELLRPATRADCATCHVAPTNELHRALVRPGARVDRELSASCNQCHTTDHWSSVTFDHTVLPRAGLARCESCHTAPTDNFHGQIRSACTECHSPPHWKPSTFNHDRFFLLDRKHNATCATCHTNGDSTRYTCFGCHEHTPAKVRAEHDEEGIRDLDHCASCHRSADGEGG